MEKNIISWYEFKKGDNVLFYGDEKNDAYKYLRSKQINVDKYVDNMVSKNDYDYLLILDNNITKDMLLKLMKYLNDNSIILFAFDNIFGISKFVSYNYVDRISPLEETSNISLSINEIENLFKENGYKNIKTYMPFPNWRYTDVILTKGLEDISEKIDKYFVKYKKDYSVLLDEINLLRKIAKTDKELFIKLSNSYLLEISKNKIQTEAKYISFNNYRKKEYQLITIIKNKIVEKKPATIESEKNIKRISKNIEYLNNYDINVLDKFEENKLFSDYIDNQKTLDVELEEIGDNEDLVIKKLNDFKEILLKNSIKHNKKNKKGYIYTLKKQKDELLDNFNFLEYAFYDMVPKNCFLINDRYYFFDQEWMEKYLPVEFILFRAVINSYSLVRKINLNNILDKLQIAQYKELFEQIDLELREKVLDKENFSNLNINYKKMYEILYEKEVLQIQNEELRQNDIKQNEYIKMLEKQAINERGK